MNPASTLSLIEFIADRYGIDMLDSHAPRSIEYRRRRLTGPEYREKLMLLQRMYQFVDDDEQVPMDPGQH